eukprot:Gregarina_sp_Poly_1__1094@NODE_1268_length_4539_cov_74_613819_g863_i0_p1_GENE_NODE_1268_length_4539_cov_74_613819_g863_i0NODE_1268_length_4539_cov_74_613819_g863_i0_p1_ORF_typecomplete_len572_score49_26ANAPC4_WD40/PF12894_7/1_8e02ANAPC4_WD40/PF12894_7/0_32ANAPC4_WD40/PF12894_7/1_6e04_NODE_1268_length_4539_cov_74_613819_g863_i020093724
MSQEADVVRLVLKFLVNFLNMQGSQGSNLKLFLTDLDGLPPKTLVDSFKDLRISLSERNIKIFPWGTRAANIPLHNSVFFDGCKKARHQIPKNSHIFINTGLGSVSSISLSDRFLFNDEETVLLAVAKSADVDTLVVSPGSTREGLLQLWSLQMSSPSEFNLRCIENVPYVSYLQFVKHPKTMKIPPSLMMLQESGTCELFEIHESATKGFSRGRRLWELSCVCRSAQCVAITTLNCNEDSSAIMVALGTQEGTALIIQMLIQHTAESICDVTEVFRQQIFITSSPLTAILWMPNGYGTFFVAGTQAGSLLLCDRRSPLSPILICNDYATRRISCLGWDACENPIAVAQLDGILFAHQFMESTRHSPSKAYMDIKLHKASSVKSNPRWIDLLLPMHRRAALLKAIEQPCKSLDVLKERICFGFEDGSIMMGRLKELDRKSYAEAGVIGWNFIGDATLDLSASNQVACNEVPLALAARSKLQSCFQRGYDTAFQDGVHVVVSRWYPMAAVFKQFAAQGSSIENPSYSACAEILAITSVCCGFLPEWGTEGVFAYSTGLGVVHILSSDQFDYT